MALFSANAEALFVATDIWVVSDLVFACPKCVDEGVALIDLAGRTTRTKTLCLPRHPELNTEDARRAESISTATSFLRTAFPTSDLHRVSFSRLIL
jgi:hypothetical protein